MLLSRLLLLQQNLVSIRLYPEFCPSRGYTG